MMINVGIYGASGYTGCELAGLLARHPHTAVRFATSRTHAGRTLADIHPAPPPLPLVDPEDVSLDEVDAVFLCLPHAAAAPTAVAALAAGVRVIDLSADFRLADHVVYEHWYDTPHPAPDLLKEAVYGLTECARPHLPGARLVANPGCYPTAVLLALQPAAEAGAIAAPIIVDAKSGVSGAGMTPKPGTHFIAVADNFTPYKIGRAHRHVPEMEQALTAWLGADPGLIFSPHLLPVPRGILATIYAPLRPGWSVDRLRPLYHAAYEEERFVDVLPDGHLPTLAHVTHSNRCAIALNSADNTLILTSAIDNLIKGAAGQAVQNFNVMMGFVESEGIG